MRKDFILILIILGLISVQAVAQKVIDVHCHNILPSYIETLDRHDAALEETFPLPTWNVESHLAFMKGAGIECSVLTMPAPQPWFGDVDESRRIIREYNEYCAALKRTYPGKFKFCASLPLPDVKVAIQEAIYALDTLGADGIKLATNSRGQYVGDVELDTLMHILNERQAVIILHPHKPSPVNEGIIANSPLAVYEYPAETTRAVINMISRNVLSRLFGREVCSSPLWLFSATSHPAYESCPSGDGIKRIHAGNRLGSQPPESLLRPGRCCNSRSGAHIAGHNNP